MSMSDPLGDMLTRIRNGQRARKSSVSAPASKLRANVLEVFKREGFIRGYTQQEIRPGVNELTIELKYHEGEPCDPRDQPCFEAGPPGVFPD